MSKFLQSLCSIPLMASCLVLLPLTSNAASGLPVFDNWSVSNGTITPGACPAGFSCETLTDGNGFIQRQMVEGTTSTTYIQTIITDQGASGNPAVLGYRDESFVRLGSSNGILSQQSQQQTDATGVFTSTSGLHIGWANPTPSASSPNLTIDQSFVSAGTAALGDEFNNTFSMLIIHGSDGNVKDRSMTIDQRVGLGDGITDSTDQQRFLLEGRQGVFTTAGSVDLVPTSFDSANNPLNGGTVTWANGDDVMLRWIGQRINLGVQGVSEFGFEGVVNNTANPVQEATTFSTTSTGIEPEGSGYKAPFDWHSTFGATPPTVP